MSEAARRIGGTRSFSAIVGQWEEIDKALVRVTGRGYDAHDPHWREREGEGLRAAQAAIKEHAGFLTARERADLKRLTPFLDVPGGREVATARTRGVAQAVQDRARLAALNAEPQPA